MPNTKLDAPMVRLVPLSKREMEHILTALSRMTVIEMTPLSGHRLGENEALRAKLREYRDEKAVTSL